MRYEWLVLAALASPAMSASATEPVSMYGIVIGQPLTIARCVLNEVPVAGPCWARAHENIAKFSPPGMQSLTVQFPVLGRPRISKFDELFVKTIDDVVEEVTLYTKGIDVADAALRQLVENFGQPTDQQFESVQNRFGAQYDYIRAEWRRTGVTVVFEGVSGDLDSGVIYATSEKARSQYRAQANSGEPKL